MVSPTVQLMKHTAQETVQSYIHSHVTMEYNLKGYMNHGNPDHRTGQELAPKATSSCT